MITKRIRYLLCVLICMCVTPTFVHARCDYQRQAELSRIASNVQLAYTYDSTEFTVFVSNLTSDLYMTDNYGKIYYGDGKEKTFHFASGTVNFNIYSNDSNCKGEKLLRKSITLPTPNAFAGYPECNQYPNFKYCQNWGELAISSEQFYSEFSKYKQSLSQKLLEGENSNLNILDTILDVLNANSFMFIFLGIIGGVTLIIVFIRKKIHK